MLFRTSEGNFGDDLNSWLWPKLAPEVCDAASAALFLGIGTIISRSLPPDKIKVVFGAGCAAHPPKDIQKNWFFYAVRGPLTAARLNLAPDLAITDPAMLVRRFRTWNPTKIHDFAFMPHYQSFHHADWTELCRREGIKLIDPRESVEKVIAEIEQTNLLLTEAMHGAIVADALRVPWVPLRIYGHFYELKWRDWTQSIEVPLNISDLKPLYDSSAMGASPAAARAIKKGLASVGMGKAKWKKLPVGPSSTNEQQETLHALKQFAQTARPMLSSQPILERLEQRLLEKLEKLRQDWRAGKFS